MPGSEPSPDDRWARTAPAASVWKEPLAPSETTLRPGAGISKVTSTPATGCSISSRMTTTRERGGAGKGSSCRLIVSRRETSCMVAGGPTRRSSRVAVADPARACRRTGPGGASSRAKARPKRSVVTVIVSPCSPPPLRRPWSVDSVTAAPGTTSPARSRARRITSCDSSAGSVPAGGASKRRPTGSPMKRTVMRREEMNEKAVTVARPTLPFPTSTTVATAAPSLPGVTGSTMRVGPAAAPNAPWVVARVMVSPAGLMSERATLMLIRPPSAAAWVGVAAEPVDANGAGLRPRRRRGEQEGQEGDDGQRKDRRRPGHQAAGGDGESCGAPRFASLMCAAVPGAAAPPTLAAGGTIGGREPHPLAPSPLQSNGEGGSEGEARDAPMSGSPSPPLQVERGLGGEVPPPPPVSGSPSPPLQVERGLGGEVGEA